MRAGGVQVEVLGTRPAQPAGQCRVEATRTSEFGEQQLLRALDPALQGPGVLPDLHGWDEQAGVGGGLQRELHPPRGRRFGVVRRRLDQAEGGPRGTDLTCADLVPRPQRLLQVEQRILVGQEPAVGAGERGQPGLGDRIDLRTTAPSRRQQRPRLGESLPGCGVHQLVQGAFDDDAGWWHLGRGAAHRWQGRDELLMGDDVGPLQDGPPGRHRAGVVPPQCRQDAATLGELVCEAGEVAQVGDGGTEPDLGLLRVAQPSQCGGWCQADDRDRPRQQGGHRPGGLPRCQPDQFGRVERCAAQGRQVQLHRIRFAGQELTESVGRHRERVGPRGTQRLTATGDREVGVLGLQSKPGLGPVAVHSDQLRPLPGGCPARGYRIDDPPIGSVLAPGPVRAP